MTKKYEVGFRPRKKKQLIRKFREVERTPYEMLDNKGKSRPHKKPKALRSRPRSKR